MKVEFLKEFEAKTVSGSKIISPGTVLDLEESKAKKLISGGIAKEFKPVHVNPESIPYLDNRGRLVIPFDCPLKYRYWAGGQSVKTTLKEIFDERAAIMEHEGGLTKDQASEEASRITSLYVKDHLNQKK